MDAKPDLRKKLVGKSLIGFDTTTWVRPVEKPKPVARVGAKGGGGGGQGGNN